MLTDNDMTTMKLGRMVQPVVLSKMETTAKNWREWLNGKSESFSALCGEDFTRKEVALAHLGFSLFVLVSIFAGWLE